LNKIYIAIEDGSFMPHILEFTAFRGPDEGHALCAKISSAEGIESCGLSGALPQEFKRIYRNGQPTDDFIHDYVVTSGPAPKEV
jgi:hypothetical protein